MHADAVASTSFKFVYILFLTSHFSSFIAWLKIMTNLLGFKAAPG